MSGHCGTNVSCELILSEGKSVCYAVFYAGRVCVFQAECVWCKFGKYVVSV